MADSNEIYPVEVYSGPGWDAAVLQSILEDNGIQVFLREFMGGTFSPNMTIPGIQDGVRVMVPNTEAERARELVVEFEANLRKKDANKED